MWQKKFQSTLPQGERRSTSRTSGSGPRNFNPRSHKGSDSRGRQAPVPAGISIHAPTRGATKPVRDHGRIQPISIHAPTRGATPRWAEGHGARKFQSTLPQGERRNRTRVAKRSCDFNPRSHKGSDSNFTQNSISVLFHFYQSFPHIIFPHTARFRLLIIFCTFFLVRIAQRFPVCFHFAPKQYPAFYNVCSTDLL